MLGYRVNLARTGVVAIRGQGSCKQPARRRERLRNFDGQMGRLLRIYLRGVKTGVSHPVLQLSSLWPLGGFKKAIPDTA